ncbi:MAG: hypothetical protein KKH94_06215 [Candidatus Omnitrophica bacterium]|nr:hypothetical protein [Candidatus Omnitrophota bacterium]
MLLELIRGYDIAGFSVLTQFYEPLADIAAFIRERLHKLIVWATTSPESCLTHADIVCIGDGEETLLNSIKTIQSNGTLEKIAGLMFQKNGQTIQTSLRHFERDLDRYPVPDFSFKEH